LSVFFMSTAMALWVDQLWNGAVGSLATMAVAPKVVLIITSVLLAPWLATGWFAVRRELKTPMAIFLALSTGYLCGWCLMFISTTFRWTFVRWRFFSLIASASVLLTIFSLVSGIVCRLNFGKGLPQYLNAEEPQAENVSVTSPSSIEKVNFPAYEESNSNSSAPFPAPLEVSFPMGYPSARQQEAPITNLHSPVRAGSHSNGSQTLIRQGSDKSEPSIRHSIFSNSTDGSNDSFGRAKRWIIE